MKKLGVEGPLQSQCVKYFGGTMMDVRRMLEPVYEDGVTNDDDNDDDAEDGSESGAESQAGATS